MIDSPDPHRPHDRLPMQAYRDVLASPIVSSVGSPAGGVPPTLVRRAVRGLRELEARRLKTRFRAPLGDAAAHQGAAGDEDADALTGLLAELRAGTTVQVCALRARGVPPERVLCEVKTSFRDAMAAEGWGDPRAMEPLMRRVVRWSIEAYYDR